MSDVVADNENSTYLGRWLLLNLVLHADQPGLIGHGIPLLVNHDPVAAPTVIIGDVAGIGIDDAFIVIIARFEPGDVLDLGGREYLGAVDGDFGQRLRDLRRPRAQESRVGRKQLDHHRLGSTRQVTDHVLEHLNELDLQDRFGHRDFPAHLVDHVVDASAAAGFQFDRNVTRIGLGHGRESEFQTRPP